MTLRFARAVLVLLCALAVFSGTALFPVAFDVDLRTAGPAAGTPVPASFEVTSPDGSVETATEDTGPGATDPRETPTRTTPDEPVPAAGSSGGSGGGADGGFGGPVAAAFGALLLVLLSAALAAVAVALRGNWRRGIRVPTWASLTRFLPAWRSLSRRLPALSLRRIPQLTTLVIVTAGSGLARVADDAAAVGRRLFGGAGGLVRPLVLVVGRSMAAVPRAVATLALGPVRALVAAATLFGGRSFLRGGVGGRGRFGAATPERDARAAADAVPSSGADSPASVADAWRAMTDLVPIRNPASRTAVEYARAAVSVGLPAGPVERLTDLFRAVRYGGGAESPDRVAAARRALEAMTGGDEE